MLNIWEDDQDDLSVQIEYDVERNMKARGLEGRIAALEEELKAAKAEARAGAEGAMEEETKQRTREEVEGGSV